jgi:hypothetical protein
MSYKNGISYGKSIEYAGKYLKYTNDELQNNYKPKISVFFFNNVWGFNYCKICVSLIRGNIFI